MCGIAGGEDGDTVVRAIASMVHRGPDAQDVRAIGKKFRFGHARLAILDLDARSNQPFSRGKTTIAFNGEIWNYETLRADLQKNHRARFKTTGDTEVLAAILDIHGVAGLSSVEGMFAVAWTSDEGRTIFLARDRFGEIPLHFAREPFCFASERKGMGSLGARPNSIEDVPPGGIVRRCGDVVEVSAYYDVPAERATQPVHPSARLRALLEKGAEERAISDVPVSVLLSGGIDSAAIALCLRPRVADLVAYTAVYDPKSRDLRCAREAAEMLEIPLVEVRVPCPSEVDLRETIRVIEMSSKAQAEIAWPCLKLGEVMKADGRKVTFSGEGSDELWASYHFAAMEIYRGADWYDYRKKLFLAQARKNFPRCNKAFMRHSIECRLPFLHAPIVEFALGLDKTSVRGSETSERRPKHVLQEAFRGDLPDSVVDRAKMGFQEGLGIREAIGKTRQYYEKEYDALYGAKKKTLWNNQK